MVTVMKLRKVFLFHLFVSIFCLDDAQNAPFFEKITNHIFRLNYTQLICEPARSENKRLCNVTVNSNRLRHCSRFWRLLAPRLSTTWAILTNLRFLHFVCVVLNNMGKVTDILNWNWYDRRKENVENGRWTFSFSAHWLRKTN